MALMPAAFAGAKAGPVFLSRLASRQNQAPRRKVKIVPGMAARRRFPCGKNPNLWNRAL
jgi:hypothetical protein